MSGRSELINAARNAISPDATARQLDNVVPQAGTAPSVQTQIDDIYNEVMPQTSGFRAFHGSPYRFSQFEFEKIGTGEGAQAYGYGLYFADVEDVAKGYRDALTQPRIEVDGKPANLIYTNAIRERFADLYDEFIDNDFAVSFKSEYLDNLPEGANKQELESALDSLIEKVKQGDESPRDFELFTPEIDDAVQGATGISINDVYNIADNVVNLDNILSNMSQASTETELGYVLDSLVGDERRFFEKHIRPRLSYVEPEGAMYEVQIGATKDQLLDWDRPVREQPEQIRNALLKIDNVDENTKGQNAYYLLARDATGLDAQKQATEAAKELGIIGIKYNDGMSRGRDAADRPITNNYVIFDPRIIQISRQYGVSIPVAGMMLANQDAEAADAASLPTDFPTPNYNPTFEHDDASGQILADRERGHETAAQRIIREKREARQQAIADETLYQAIPRQMESVAREYAIPAVKDILGGMVEGPKMAFAGFLEATAQMAEKLEAVVSLGGEPMRIEADPRTVTGAGIKTISQFITGFAPASRAVKAIGVTGYGGSMAAGALTDALVFDPHEDRLSNIIQEVPELENPITEYLAASPDDSMAEGMFKNAVEGLGLGAAVDTFIAGVRAVKRHRELVRAAEEEGTTIDELASDVEQQLADATEMPEGQEFIPFEQAVEAVQPTIRVGIAGATEAGPEAAQNINLANLETTEDVQRLIDGVAEADAQVINQERRQIITNEELPRLASDLGMTVEELLERKTGQAFNAEQILAARQILVASGETLINLAKKAQNGSEADLVLFRRALSQHRAIQAQVSGLTAEAGRALQSFRIVAEGSREQNRLIREALETTGGEQTSRRMAEMFAELDDVSQVGRLVKESSKPSNFDRFYEFWINALLSAPITHSVNIVSNFATALFSVAERGVASRIGGGRNIPIGEADIQLKGMVAGMADGLRLAWQALKTGEPSDQLGKIEVAQRHAISGDSLELAGVAGRAADFLGTLVRVPGRLLTTADEFFKAVGYRMELNAQAYRQAFNEGLQGRAFAERVNDIIQNPPENIRLAAVDASRYQTFTSSLDRTGIQFMGRLGRAGENIRNAPGVGGVLTRIILPFIRTPTNVASYTLERTPLAFMSKNVREEIKAGGARKDLALGKIAVGSTVMAVSADLAFSGQITGAGPTDYKMRNILRETGWQPYSIKVGDTYYAYNRLDPIGAVIGLAADITEIIAQTDDVTASELATAAVISIAQNMASKTYVSNLTQFLDAIMSASTDPESANNPLTRVLNRMAGSLIPSGVATIERSVDPTVRASYDMLDQIKSRIPGYSDDLPPRRNIFGEPVVLSGGLGPDWMSPVYTSREMDDDVSVISREMVENQVSIGMPSRVIQGIELSPQQYDRYVLLIAGVDENGERTVPISQNTLKEELLETIYSSQYQRGFKGPDGNRNTLIRGVFNDYRSRAQDLLIREDYDLQAALQRQQDAERRNALEQM